MVKLGARDRAQLVVFAYESGLVPRSNPLLRTWSFVPHNTPRRAYTKTSPETTTSSLLSATIRSDTLFWWRKK